MKNKVIFISDMHLQACEPRAIASFINVITQYKNLVDCIFILGDFFEAWLGDDHNEPWIDEIKNCLYQASQTVQIRIMTGNRDFLLGKKFLKQTGATKLEDPTLIELYGTKILLTHGDLLCTFDQKYQNYRKKVNNIWAQRALKSLPLSLRKKIAERGRKASQSYNSDLDSKTMDVNPETVNDFFQNYGAEVMIHGHTHKPNFHLHQVDGVEKTRIVLGSWHGGANAIVWDKENGAEYITQL